MADNPRDLALFNMAIDSKLRGCDLVRLKVRDVFAAGRVRERASITQRKTGQPVRFEITEPTRQSLERWVANPEMLGTDFLWPSRFHESPHLSTRQYARILRGWVTSIGLDPSSYGTHSMRRTKEDRKPARGPAPARSHQDGQHGPLPRRRARRRPDNLRSHKPLTRRRPVMNPPALNCR
jgi:integrase